MPSFRLNVRTRTGAIALGIAVVLIGFVVIVSGLALLIGIALIGGLLAGTAILIRKVFGQSAPASVRPDGLQRFDPSLEVFPPDGPVSGQQPASRIRSGEDAGVIRPPRGGQ